MASTDGVLDPRWRKRIEEVGKNAFEIEEMVRLGFLKADELEKQLKATGLSYKEYQTCLDDLAKASAEQARRLAKSLRLERWRLQLQPSAPGASSGSRRRERKGASERLLSVTPERRRSAANGSKHLLFLVEESPTDSPTTAATVKSSVSWACLNLTISAKSHLPSTLNPSICNGWCTNEETAR